MFKRVLFRNLQTHDTFMNTVSEAAHELIE